MSNTHRTENIWINDEKYKSKIRKIPLTFFFDNSDEEIKKEIIKLFKTNKLDLLKIFLNFVKGKR